MQSKRRSLSLSIALVVMLCLSWVLASAFIPTPSAYAAAGNYYSGITATSGTALLGQLHDLIVTSRTKYSSYADCKTYATDTDPGSGNNTVMDFYTQADIDVNKWDVSGGWNREHVWPKANSNGLWQSNTVGGGADLHHIRPSEKDINNDRGNLLYGEVSNGYPRYPTDINIIGGYTSGNTFEPIDSVKGDVARICMYVYTHYNNYSNVSGTTNGSGNSSYFGTLKFRNNVAASNEEAAIKLLLKWNKLDPVDDIERNRNEAAYRVQGNRNPFIDNESYADAIWGGGTLEKVELQSLTLTPNALTLTEGESQTLTVAAVPSGANASVTWSSSDSSIATVNNGKVSALKNGSATITATSVENANIKATATVTVNKAPVVTAIELLGTPTNTQYQAGQEFDPTGLTVKFTYDDNTTANINPQSDARLQWVDADSGQKMLTLSTTKIKCKLNELECVGSFTVTVVEATDNIGQFTEAVAKISAEKTLQGRFDAIKTAVNSYKKLSAAEKSDSRTVTAYDTLLQAIDVYNAEIRSYNDGLKSAVSVSGAAICSTMLAAAALVLLLQRKLG